MIYAIIISVILGSVGFYFLSKYFLIKQSSMVLNIFKVVFVVVIAIVAYMNYDSVDSKITLTETVEMRDKVVHEKLEKIRDAQVEYKKLKGSYAGTFSQLIDFLKNDSIVQVKMEGEVPDTLLGREAEALAMGIIKRDTTKIPVREVMFKDNFDNFVDSMEYIPFSDGEKFTIAAGEVEKGKVNVKVFEVKAPVTSVYKGLKVENEGYDLTLFVAIGSMEEPTINGNWK